MRGNCATDRLIHANTNVKGYSYARNGITIHVGPYFRTFSPAKKLLPKELRTRGEAIKKVNRDILKNHRNVPKNLKTIRDIGSGEFDYFTKGDSNSFRKAKQYTKNYSHGTERPEKTVGPERERKVAEEHRAEPAESTVRYNPHTLEPMNKPSYPKAGANREVDDSTAGKVFRDLSGVKLSEAKHLADVGKYAVEMMEYGLIGTDYSPEELEYWKTARERNDAGRDSTSPAKEAIDDIRNSRFMENFRKYGNSDNGLVRTIMQTAYDSIVARAEEDRRHLEELGLGGRGTMLTRTPGGPSAWVKEKK